MKYKNIQSFLNSINDVHYNYDYATKYDLVQDQDKKEYKEMSKMLNKLRLPLTVKECKTILNMLSKTPNHYFKTFLKNKTITDLKQVIKIPALKDDVVKTFSEAVKAYQRKCKWNLWYKLVISSKPMKTILEHDKMSKRIHDLQQKRMFKQLKKLGIKHVTNFETFKHSDNCFITDDDMTMSESTWSRSVKNKETSKLLKSFNLNCYKFFEKNQAKKSDFYIKLNGKRIVLEQKVLSEEGGGQDKQFVEVFNVLKAANGNDKNFYAIAQIDGDFWTRWNQIAQDHAVDCIADNEAIKALQDGNKKDISFANVIELCKKNENSYLVNEKNTIELLKRLKNS